MDLELKNKRILPVEMLFAFALNWMPITQFQNVGSRQTRLKMIITIIINPRLRSFRHKRAVSIKVFGPNPSKILFCCVIFIFHFIFCFYSQTKVTKYVKLWTNIEFATYSTQMHTVVTNQTQKTKKKNGDRIYLLRFTFCSYIWE